MCIRDRSTGSVDLLARHPHSNLNMRRGSSLDQLHGLTRSTSATNLEAVITVSADLFPDPSDLVCPVRASKGHRRKPSSGRLQQFPLVKRGCCHWKKPSLHALVPLVLLVLVLWTLHHSFGLYNVASWMVRVSARM
eukprot:TRINITY_DN1012_c0_g1_i1.p1 TRINITY_DN1012_c0_g1~~TRINITY_DN1012_c0_g1_i1.p1  ORF type:complete len:136 (+),score=11.03 TRINITY_DN1012_c0_g1_i1:92-499(+)